ncbi:hypothetical protein [Pseudomonas fluorescens]|jgi:nucleoside phosphorylase|uniref:hypothetical protein n=1 Tax=Pseudomonas fluorescens TaxID=294 RepID=UPI0020052B62|nr:hypothetical protein [Pseudomonas fluorescens]MCK3831606.1 hypothetical protein [Pseudomonas fluorescens]
MSPQPPTRLEKIFLHFFDTHFIEEKGLAAKTPLFKQEMRLATRMAVATAQTVYIPAASYFESELCRSILNELEELIGLGVIVLLGSSVNVEEYLLERQDVNFYREGSEQYSWYRAQHSLEQLPAYLRRSRSATKDIGDHWRSLVADDTLSRNLHDASIGLPNSLAKRLELVPEELGRLAFIPEHVLEILDLKLAPSLVQARIRDVINEGYFESYVRDLGAGVIVDLKYLSSSFKMPSHGDNLSYARMSRLLRETNLLAEFNNCHPAALGPISDKVGWQIASQHIASYPIAPTNAIAHTQTTSSRNLLIMTPSDPSNSTKSVPKKILCIAAAQIELDAVRAKLIEILGVQPKIRYIDSNMQYPAVYMVDPESGAEWFLATLALQGNSDAAGGSSLLYHKLNPDLILMVGMCMGMPKRKLEIGTVIIPAEVIGLDHSRVTEDTRQTRPHFNDPANSIQRLARLMDYSERPYPVVADKAVASATVKIEDPNAELIVRIEESFPDAIAFDMESFGLYRGLPKEAQCLWIKGVADNGDPQSGTMGGRADKQIAQKLASGNAADFALELSRQWLRAISE